MIIHIHPRLCIFLFCYYLFHSYYILCIIYLAQRISPFIPLLFTCLIQASLNPPGRQNTNISGETEVEFSARKITGLSSSVCVFVLLLIRFLIILVMRLSIAFSLIMLSFPPSCSSFHSPYRKNLRLILFKDLAGHRQQLTEL